MVKKKGDLAFTVIHLPVHYPTLDIITQISPVTDGFDGTVCLNIAPQLPPSTFKQVNGTALQSSDHDYSDFRS